MDTNTREVALEDRIFHNVSSSPPGTPFSNDDVKQNMNKLEVKAIPDESSHLKFVDQLGLEHEINGLKLENEMLKSKDEKSKYVKLEKKISLLEKQNKGLTAENMILLKAQKPTEERIKKLEEEIGCLQKERQTKGVFEGNDVFKFIPIKERLIDQGVKRFIEGIKPETKIYDTYSQWYDHITEIMETGFVYEYDKYLFVRDLFESNTNSCFYRSYGKNKEMCSGGFKSETLDRGWAKENIKLILILHPTNARESVELNHRNTGKDDQTDSNKKYNYHHWETNSIKFTTKNIDSSNSGKCHSMILCCIKS